MRVLKSLNEEKLVFYDIETATVVKDLEIDTPLFDSWKWKCDKKGEMSNDELVEAFKDRAGLYPEFSKIVSVVIGKIISSKIHLITFDDKDEADLLRNLNQALDRNSDCKLVGFFSSGFDAPFTYKRMIINGVNPSTKLDYSGLKPWEVTDIDLAMEWKGTSFERASLLNISTAFGLPSPKDGDVAGKDVGIVYWNEGDSGLAKISKYCRRDVVTTINVFKKMRLEDTLERATGEPLVFEDIPLVTSLFQGASYAAAQKKELVAILKGLTTREREMAYTILDSVTSTAKGKVTKLTKAHVKALKKAIDG